MNFEGGYFVTPNIGLGLFLNYHSNHEYVGRETFKMAGGDVTTDLNCQSILAYPLSDSCALAGMAKAIAMTAKATTLKYIFFLVFITVVVVYLLVR